MNERIDLRCPNCQKPFILPRENGFFLRTRGAMFGYDLSKKGRVLCKNCGKWVRAPIYLNI